MTGAELDGLITDLLALADDPAHGGDNADPDCVICNSPRRAADALRVQAERAAELEKERDFLRAHTEEVAKAFNEAHRERLAAEARIAQLEAETVGVLEPFAKAATLEVRQARGKATVVVVRHDNEVFPGSVITWGHVRIAAQLHAKLAKGSE